MIGDSFATDPAIGSAKVDHNVIDEYQKTGVYSDGEGSFAEVDHNVIRAAEDVQPFIAPNGIVIRLAPAPRSTTTRSAENKFGPPPGHPDEATPGTGIILDTPEIGGVRVDHNEVFDNDDGISSYDSDGQRIEHNLLVRQHQVRRAVLRFRVGGQPGAQQRGVRQHRARLP